jgi:hypothetical protein
MEVVRFLAPAEAPAMPDPFAEPAPAPANLLARVWALLARVWALLVAWLRGPAPRPRELSDDEVRAVCARLDASSAAAMACACRRFRDLCAPVAQERRRAVEAAVRQLCERVDRGRATAVAAEDLRGYERHRLFWRTVLEDETLDWATTSEGVRMGPVTWDQEWGKSTAHLQIDGAPVALQCSSVHGCRDTVYVVAGRYTFVRYGCSTDDWGLYRATRPADLRARIARLREDPTPDPSAPSWHNEEALRLHRLCAEGEIASLEALAARPPGLVARLFDHCLTGQEM